MICSSINKKAKCICSKKFGVLQRKILRTELPRISVQRAILYGTSLLMVRIFNIFNSLQVRAAVSLAYSKKILTTVDPMPQHPQIKSSNGGVKASNNKIFSFSVLFKYKCVPKSVSVNIRAFTTCGHYNSGTNSMPWRTIRPKN